MKSSSTGKDLGTFTVGGGAQAINGVNYALMLDGSALSVTLSETEKKNKPDDGSNDYLYDRKLGWNTEENVARFADNQVAGNCELGLDVAGTVDKDNMHNMFGNGGTSMDTGDFAKISVAAPAKLSFTIDSTAAGTFYVYEDGFDKKVNDCLNSLRKKTAVKVKDYSVGNTAKTAALHLDAGEYYISVTAKKTTGNEKGSAFYNVTAFFSPDVSDALAMPQTDSLSKTDKLSFGLYGADALADASAAAGLNAGPDDKSAWLNIAGLA